jgi:hypothetical protein
MKPTIMKNVVTFSCPPEWASGIIYPPIIYIMAPAPTLIKKGKNH